MLILLAILGVASGLLASAASQAVDFDQVYPAAHLAADVGPLRQGEGFGVDRSETALKSRNAVGLHNSDVSKMIGAAVTPEQLEETRSRALPIPCYAFADISLRGTLSEEDQLD